jgi:hypothetical protein
MIRRIADVSGVGSTEFQTGTPPMSAVILPSDGRSMLAALAAMDNPSLLAVKAATAKSPRMSADRPKTVIVLAWPQRSSEV